MYEEEGEEENNKKKGNSLPHWGNSQTMNINNLIVTNILSSPYFKHDLIKLKTFHEVIDEIYYKVEHLEPWEKGSRKLHGQVGMCGGVRGVGTGGIVSSTFCLLYKLFTLKLTKKQVYVLIEHVDSPYIRALGFMYIRYCQHPNSFWEWYEPYLEDDEEIDPKAGGGSPMTIGQMVRSFLLKLDWYGTLFPRIPVPIHKDLEANLKAKNLNDDRKVYANDDERDESQDASKEKGNDELSFGEAERYSKSERKDRSRRSPSHGEDDRRHRRRSSSRERQSSSKKRTDKHEDEKSRHRRDDDRKSSSRHRSRDRSRERKRDSSRERKRDSSRERKRDSSRERKRDRSREKSRKRSRSRERKRSRSRDRR